MVLQPQPQSKPGLALPGVGINFDSTQTWWELAGTWNEYLARCQYLLQQGQFVADAAVLTSEGAPNILLRPFDAPVDPSSELDTSTFPEGVLRRCGQMLVLPPVGYDYDGVNADAVLQMTAQGERLTLPHGMSYRILMLPPERRMTLALARKIRELVKAGATVVGPKPHGSPSLADFPQGDVEIQAIADEVWADCDTARATSHTFGNGRVFCGDGIAAALVAAKLLPDFEVAGLSKGSPPPLDFIHRRTAEAEIYFVTNRKASAIDVPCTFRVSGRLPEIWLPDTGRIFRCQAFRQQQGRTMLPLHLPPYGSMFVVFREPINASSAGQAESNFPDTKILFDIAGPWAVRFDPHWGGPADTVFERLRSWSDRAEPGIRYYSGTAVYQKTFQVDAAQLTPQCPVYLDLGMVKDFARVWLNGKDLGALWKPPFRVDVTGILHPGQNNLEVQVTNLWPNRLIGDAGLPTEKRVATVSWNPYRADSPLLPSGLLGPVQIGQEKCMRGRPITVEEFERMIDAALKVRPLDADQWIRLLTALWLSEVLPMTPDFAEWLLRIFPEGGATRACVPYAESHYPPHDGNTRGHGHIGHRHKSRRGRQ
jgi:hypothetical protein